MKKSLLFTFVCISVFLFLNAVTASAAKPGDLRYGNLYYTISNGKITITGCPLAETTVDIPEQIDGYPVTAIGEQAFYGCNKLVSIAIPDTVTNIKYSAFEYCTMLESINIPQSVNSIGYQAFYDCQSLSSIELPDNITKIEDCTFSNCSKLTDIAIPDKVTSIGERAFYGCNELESIYIPKNVSFIGGGILGECTRLKEIKVDQSNKFFCGLDGVLYNKDKTTIIQYAAGKTNSTFKISDSITNIGDNAFAGSRNLEYITISENVSAIGKYAFNACTGLKEINIPDGITSINSGTFGDCTSLANITLPDSITNIDTSAFFSCTSLIQIKLPPHLINIGDTAFFWCSGLKSITIPDNVTRIGGSAFYHCSSLTDITIPKSITEIQYYTFNDCPSLSTVYYNGNNQDWDKIRILGGNDSLTNATKYFSVSITIIDETGKEISKKNYSAGAYINLSDIEEKFEHTIHLYTDKEYINELDLSLPLTDTMVLYLRYVPNQYKSKFINDDGTIIFEKFVDYGAAIIPPENPTKENTPKYTYTFEGWDGFYEGITQTNLEMIFTAKYKSTINQYNAKFVDDDGTVIFEKLVDYGAAIIPPENPTKARTQQYTYTFTAWDGFYNGITQENREMVFTAKYDAVINQYTYKFIDSDGTVINEETVDYGTVVVIPETPADKDPYTFDYWEGYSDGMPLTDNTEFKAVYKYKTYTITIKGLENPINAMYGDAFEIETQIPEPEYLFGGYFTEENGNGIKVTDENGKSLENYGFLKNITLYPYFSHELLNKIKINGESSTVVGNTDVVKKVYFATNKEASYLLCNIKYPKSISLKKIVPIDFKYVSEESRKTVDGIVYLNLICQYTNSLDNLPINVKLEPFELVFDIPKDTTPQNAIIEVTSESMLIGENDYTFDYIINGTLEIAAKPVESISIIGDDSVGLENGDISYAAEITPDYATNKEVVWSVDNEETAKISQSGVLTPLKLGKVIITATAKDGSGVSAKKEINILPLAKIDSLSVDIGQWDKEFNADTREYTVYVPYNTNKLSLTANYTGGMLKVNNGETTSIMIKNRAKKVTLNENDTNVILLRENQPGCANSEYKITIVKFEGTKTAVSDNAKTFTVKPINITNGSTVILALYNGEKLVETKSGKCSGLSLSFTTDKTYTNAKVMVWENTDTVKPIYDVETIK